MGSAQRESAISACKMVDLPESFGPTSTVIGPSGIVAEAIALKWPMLNSVITPHAIAPTAPRPIDAHGEANAEASGLRKRAARLLLGRPSDSSELREDYLR